MRTRRRLMGLGFQLSALLLPLLGQAQGSVRQDTVDNLRPIKVIYGGDQATNLRQYIFLIINMLLSVIGVILICYLIYGGYIWMMAQGEEEEVRRARGIIRTAIIGVIIIFASYAIANFVLVNLWKASQSNGFTF